MSERADSHRGANQLILRDVIVLLYIKVMTYNPTTNACAPLYAQFNYFQEQLLYRNAHIQ